MGDSLKWVKSRRQRKKERKLVKTMAKLRMAHASTHGARKPPGPKFCMIKNLWAKISVHHSNHISPDLICSHLERMLMKALEKFLCWTILNLEDVVPED